MKIKIKIAVIAMIGMSLRVKGQENVSIGLNSPSYGVKIKANWPGANGGWARGFTLSNQNGSEDFIQFGALGNIKNGISDLTYGYIGKNYYDTFMVFRPNGSIGIGTTNVGIWKLAVNGKIRAKEIKVETGWSDFVFYDNYNLPTLKEVESHIKEKGHLKDIPSAKEVKENGIFLGEMDAKLLQKIEELTLYTIAQEKEIKKEKAENKKQQKEIDELKALVQKLLKDKN